MELVIGGELYDVLQLLQLLNTTQTRFYTGCILLALEYLHARRIAYLDLKPENILVDHQGYLKIIDFGIAQRIRPLRMRNITGTPWYVAPEMIGQKGYDTTADLWGLGICVSEFLVGKFPFATMRTTTGGSSTRS